MVLSRDDLARRAAQRLSGELDPNLAAAVEAQLEQPSTTPERFELGTLIALATLLLNVTKFASDVYRDRKKDLQSPPTPEAIARTIRLELKADEGVLLSSGTKLSPWWLTS